MNAMRLSGGVMKKEPIILVNALKLDEGSQRAFGGNYYHVRGLLSELALDRRIHLKVLTDELTNDEIKAVVPEHMLWPQVLKNGGVRAADRVVKKSIRELNPHIYHRPTGQLPFGLYSCKCVAGIADLTFRHLRTPLIKRLYKEISYFWTVQRADWIICISEYTRQDLIKRFHANPLTTTVAYLGESALPPADDSVAEKVGKPFFITFGHHWRKNVEVCLEALALTKKKYGINCHLVVIGKNSYLSKDIAALSGRLGLEDNVYFVGRIDSAQLHGLYRSAIGLLFMSFFEGFGLPVLEAMQCNCPVICSNVCSLPEVAGNAAILLGPQDKEGLSEAMKKLMFDGQCRDMLIARARQQAKEFSWKRAADHTVEVYLRLHSKKEMSSRTFARSPV